MTLRLIFSMLIFALMGFHVAAQERPPQAGSPRLSVTLSDGPYIVGQPITLRVKILVPTWMPTPPVYPSFEQPNLLIRLPERSTHPVSETISGETWSGTSRTYQLYPLELGAFRIPSQSVQITSAGPSAQPVKTEHQLEAISFTAELPKGAEMMEPPVIVASDFSLDQEFSELEELNVGDALTRRVIAQIEGTTAILIPSLIPTPIQSTSETGEEQLSSLRGYPKDPTIEESVERGSLSGNRIEEVSYLAQVGGSATLPSIEIEWFNIDMGTVETARLDALTVQVAKPPEARRAPSERALQLATALAFLALAVLVLHSFRPRLHNYIQILKTRWMSSELFARRAVQQSIKSEDLWQLQAKLATWGDHFPSLTPSQCCEIEQALTQVGRGLYGPSTSNRTTTNKTTADCHKQWKAVKHAYTRLCSQAKADKKRQTGTNSLPGLNPPPVSPPPHQ
ncbi:protein BatD [Parasedimentitalea maritima]|uniref:Protein BatD n=1 Tax=Parasedimentitalea maritima TaxID=2578117 RepID=A0ABY2UVX6_9RHOB|nr:BatD family protein [Zongyanglinia marina]TLP57660.1 protein BatD [Zongyanglinia marina]